MLTDEISFGHCMEVVEEAKSRVKIEEKEEKRRQLSSATRQERTPEEIEIAREKGVNRWIFKLFADSKKRKDRAEVIEAAERKRTAEAIEERDQLRKKREEFEELWESQREDRVDSWRNFTGPHKKRRVQGGIKRPELQKRGGPMTPQLLE